MNNKSFSTAAYNRYLEACERIGKMPRSMSEWASLIKENKATEVPSVTEFVYHKSTNTIHALIPMAVVMVKDDFADIAEGKKSFVIADRASISVHEAAIKVGNPILLKEYSGDRKIVVYVQYVDPFESSNNTIGFVLGVCFSNVPVTEYYDLMDEPSWPDGMTVYEDLHFKRHYFRDDREVTKYWYDMLNGDVKTSIKVSPLPTELCKKDKHLKGCDCLVKPVPEYVFSRDEVVVMLKNVIGELAGNITSADVMRSIIRDTMNLVIQYKHKVIPISEQQALDFAAASVLSYSMGDKNITQPEELKDLLYRSIV